ncbi:MAG: N-formylglutamate amidohydrolase [Rubricoccaceae bacterium]|nr:N-formylglutamate amidohydrolase [Rubricoccaceae bacterium]
MDSYVAITRGDGPLVAAALHDGHAIRPDLRPHLALAESERLREEDPFTRRLTAVAPTRIVGLRSRFEVDLNRPPEKAVYRTPGDAWGLTVWHGDVPEAAFKASLDGYRAAYAEIEALLAEKVARHGAIVVYDLHSYNHRREGPDGPAAPEAENPEVNIGTGSLDGERWSGLVDRFMEDLSEAAAETALGRRLDVRENVKFQGGYFSRWVHGRFPGRACVLAIEFKKVFMDEWTGEPDEAHLGALRGALQATVPGVLAERTRVAESILA